MRIPNGSKQARYIPGGRGRLLRLLRALPEQKQAVLDREWSEILNLGGTIFYVYKLAMVLGVSMQDLGGIFTGMSTDEFKTMLKNGGNK